MIDRKLAKKSEAMRRFDVMIREAITEVNEKPLLKRKENKIEENPGVVRKKREKVG